MEAFPVEWPTPTQPQACHGDAMEAIMARSHDHQSSGDEIEAMLAMLNADRRATIAPSTSQ